MISIVIIDDHPIVRTGMRMVLDAADDVTVVAEGTSGADALEMLAPAVRAAAQGERWLSPTVARPWPRSAC